MKNLNYSSLSSYKNLDKQENKYENNVITRLLKYIVLIFAFLFVGFISNGDMARCEDVDSTRPSVSIEGYSSWSKGTSVNISWSDDDSGVIGYWYSFYDYGDTNTATSTHVSFTRASKYAGAPISIPNSSNVFRGIRLCVKVEDVAGNYVSTCRNLKVDNVRPSINVSGDSSSWAKSHSVDVSTLDMSGSSLTTYYKWSSSTTTPSSSNNDGLVPSSGVVTKSGVTGEYYLCATVIDSAGNQASTCSSKLKFDNTAPTIGSVTISSTGWSLSKTGYFKGLDDDDSGLNNKVYVYWDSTKTKPSASLNDAIITADSSGNGQHKASWNGTWYFCIGVYDNAGNYNSGCSSSAAKIDNKSPVASISIDNSEFASNHTATINASDSTSGINKVYYKWSSDKTRAETSDKTVTLISGKATIEGDVSFVGEYYLCVLVTDKAGNSIGACSEAMYFGGLVLLDDTIYFHSLQLAINEKTTSRIKLLGDITECVTVDGTRNINLDMNGKTLMCANDVTIINVGTLTVTGNGAITNTSSGSNSISINNSGTLTIIDGVIEGQGTDSAYENNARYGIYQTSGTTIINGGEIKANLIQLDSDTNDGVAEAIYIGTGILDINDGEIIGGRNGVSVRDGVVNICGGTVYGTSYGVHSNGGEVNVNEGNISGDYGIKNEGGKLNVSGGTISGTASGIYNLVSLTITGGSITGNIGLHNSSTAGASVTISGGEIIGNTAEGILNNNTTAITISGGEIISETTYAVEGSISLSGGKLKANTSTVTYTYNSTSVINTVSEYTYVSGEYYVTEIYDEVAQIGSTNYDTLQEAINVGGTITFLKNVTINNPLTISKNIVLDLNGKTLNTYKSAIEYNENLYSFIIVNRGASLDIKTGDIIGVHENVILINNIGNLVLDGATLQAELNVLANNNFAKFTYNSGVLRSKNALYTGANRDIYVADGYYMRESENEDYRVLSLVNGNKLDVSLSNSANIEIDSNNVEKNLIITLNQTISNGSMKVYLKSNVDGEYEKELSCTNAGLCSVKSSQVEYASNVDYANELVIKYVEGNDTEYRRLNLKITRKFNVSVKEIALDSHPSAMKAVSDGDIIMVNSTKNMTYVTLNKEDFAKAVLGENATFSDISLSEIDTRSCENPTEGSNVCLFNVIVSFKQAYGIEEKLLNTMIPVLVYKYAIKEVVGDTLQTRIECEVGSSCLIKELSFANYENTENVITIDGQVVNSISTKKPGKYVVSTYGINDDGQKSQSVIREYNVVDTIAPVINFDNNIKIKKGSLYDYLDIDIIDNGGIASFSIISNNVNLNKAGMYEIVYKVVDIAGNETIATRTIIVSEDYSVIFIALILVVTIASAVIILIDRKQKIDILN